MGQTNEPNLEQTMVSHLHEQYAINNNSNLSSVLTVLVSLLAVFALYGNAFVSTSCRFSKDFDILFLESKGNIMYLDVLFFSYIACSLILCFLFCLCVYQGVAQRKEQFIIDSIRIKNNIFNEENIVFPKKYHPYNKKGFGVVQGLYGEFLRIFIATFIFITLLTLTKLIANVINNYSIGISCIGLSIVMITMILVTILICCTRCYYNKQISGYKMRQMEFCHKMESEYIMKSRHVEC